MNMRTLLTITLLFAVSAVLAEPTQKITITGQVTDKNGVPVKQCDVFFNATSWINEDSVHVQCDSNGNYHAEIQAGEYNSVYVCDEELYGKTKLEYWAWNLNLQESQILNAQFDRMEVYSLSTWASNGGSNSLFASFRPMSLQMAKAPTYRQIQHNNRSIMLFDITPNIEYSSIKGIIDEQPIELIDYSWAYEKVASCGHLPEGKSAPNGCYMPMIVAQFKKPKLTAGNHTLTINLSDAESGDFGQGVTHFTSNKAGLGF